MRSMKPQFLYTWEEAINILRKDPEHQKLIFNSYLTDDLFGNAKRFAESVEFGETMELVKKYCPSGKRVLDIPGGNGIATYAFARQGFETTVVEPDPSPSVGRGAIKKVLEQAHLNATIVEGFGENLPLKDNTFDIVYVRQGLHHAHDLVKMVAEYYRVLKNGGILLACREHVVDNHGKSLKAFLDAQVDHQLYGGENAFTLAEYRNSFKTAGFFLLEEIKPYDSPINLFPKTKDSLSEKVISTPAGRILSHFLPRWMVLKLGLWALRFFPLPGRMYSFVAAKR